MMGDDVAGADERADERELSMYVCVHHCCQIMCAQGADVAFVRGRVCFS